MGSLEVRFGAKLQDVNPIRLALALLYTLNQTDPLQLRKQLSGGHAAAAEVLADLRDGVIHIRPAFPVPPAVPDGQAHAIEQQAEQQLSCGRQRAILPTLDKLPGNPVKRKALALRARIRHKTSIDATRAQLDRRALVAFSVFSLSVTMYCV